ncbi:MAG: hypothetical protein JWO36_5467 [Myxococcales bacterium]|nr:hypothetical protein [Myxococcales bacterium]
MSNEFDRRYREEGSHREELSRAELKPGKHTNTDPEGPVPKVPGKRTAAEGLAERARESSGSALPHALQARFADAFGTPVSDITIHVGAESAAAAEAFDSHAYVDGRQVHFNSGQYDPTSPRGQALIAHEVAHVIQARGGARPPLDDIRDDHNLEAEADLAAAAVMRGQNASVASRGASAVMRKKKSDPDPVLDKPDESKKPADGKQVDGKQVDGKQDAKDPSAKDPSKKDGDGATAGGPKSGADVTIDPKAANASGGKGLGPDAGGKHAKGDPTQVVGGKDVAAHGPAAIAGNGGGKLPQPYTAKSTAAPVVVSAVDVHAIEALHLDSPKANKKLSDKWLTETGMTVEQHHAKIVGELGGLTSVAQAHQTELMTALDTQINKVTQDITSQVDVFKSSVVTPGRARVAAAYDGMTGTLANAEKKALGDIAANKKAGTAQIQAARTAKGTDLTGKFATAKKVVDTLVAQTQPKATEAIKKFAAGVKPFIDIAKDKAHKATDIAAAKFDPSLGSASKGLGSAATSLKNDVYKNHLIDHGKQLGGKYEATMLAIGKDVDAKAEKMVRDAIDPAKIELEASIDVYSKGSGKNLDATATAAAAHLDTQEVTAQKAVEGAKASSTKRIDTEKAGALDGADQAGKELTDNVTAASAELTDRIKKRAHEDAQSYGHIVTDLQKTLKRGGPFKYEQIAPKIADAKVKLEAAHQANLGGLTKFASDGTAELGITLGKQKDVYLAAITDRENQAKQVGGEIVKDVGKGATDLGGSLSTLSAGFADTATKETAKLDKSVAEFNASARKALGEFDKQVTLQLSQIRAKLDADLEKATEPGAMEADVHKAAEADIQKKTKLASPDASGLRTAMDGWGTDENKIYSILRKCSYGQIEYLEATYDDHFDNRGKGSGKRPLRYDLADEMSGNELKIAMSYLDHDRTTAIKLELDDSCHWWNDDEKRIEEVMRSCSESEITYLNTNPEAIKVVNDTKSHLGGCDLDVMTTLLDQSIAKEDRETKANAIRLFDAMDGIGTDEAKIKSILEGAATPEERARLRAQFNTYAAAKGWDKGNGTEDGDALALALKDDESGSELTLALELAKVNRNDKDVAVAKMLDGAEGIGTNEDQIFEALEDEKYAEEWKAAKTDEERKALEDKHKADIDARMKKMGGAYDNVQDLIDGEMTKSDITFGELKARKRNDGTAIDNATRDMFKHDGPLSNLLEWMVAERKMKTGQAEPELMLAYACWNSPGTDEETINKVLSTGGEPKSRAEIKAIRMAFQAMWGEPLTVFDELSRCDLSFPDPGGVLSDELGGKDWNKTRVLLCGKPETPEQLNYVQKLQAHYAKSGLIGGVLMDAAEKIGYTDAKSTQENSEQKFDKQYNEKFKGALAQKNFGELGADGERLQQLGEYLQQDTEAYNKALESVVDAVVTVLEVVGGIIVTVVTAGTASPVLAAVIGNLIVSAGTITFKYAALGAQYGAGDLAADVIKAVGTSAFAGLTEVKALQNFSEGVGKTVTGKLFTVFDEGVKKGGGRLVGTAMELGPKGIENIEKIVAAGTKNVILASGQEVYNTLTNEKTYDKKLGEALWGEDSLGARLLKGAPRAFMEGAVKQAIDSAAGTSNIDNEGRTKGPLNNMIANAMSDMGANTAGFFVYVDNYNDAEGFWAELLKSNATKGVTGFAVGYGMHKARAKKTARDFINGDLSAAGLEEMAHYLDAKEQKELVDFVVKHGDPTTLPDHFKKLAGITSKTTTPTTGPDLAHSGDPEAPQLDHHDPEGKTKTKQEEEKAAADKAAAAKKADEEKSAADKAAASKKAAEEKAAEEKAAAQKKADEEKLAADKAAAEKEKAAAAQKKAEEDKQAADKAAADKAAAEKAAAQKKADEEKVAAEKAAADKKAIAKAEEEKAAAAKAAVDKEEEPKVVEPTVEEVAAKKANAEKEDAAALKAIKKRTAEEIAAREKEIAAAREETRIRDEQLVADLHQKTVTNNGAQHIEEVFDHVTIGAGFAGVANEMSRPKTAGEKDIVIGGKNPWDGAKSKFGQGAGDSEVPKHQAEHGMKETASDPEARFMLAHEHADNVALNKNAAKIKTYDGKVGPIESGPDSTWPDFAKNGGATARFAVTGPDGQVRYFYTKATDLAGGPGPNRKLPDHVMSPETLEAMKKAGAFAFGDQGFNDSSVKPGEIANIGAGAAGAWGSEAAASKTKSDGSKANQVEWIGVHPQLANQAEGAQRDKLTAINKEIAEAKESGNPARVKAAQDALTQFTFEEAARNGNLPRNQEPGAAFDPKMQKANGGNIERRVVEGISKITYEPEVPGGPPRVKITLQETDEHGQHIVIWKDALVLSIGQDAKGAGGPVKLVEQYRGKLVPIFGPEDAEGFRPVVGVKSPNGEVRIMGAASTVEDISAMLDQNVMSSAQHQKNLRDQASKLGPDSRGVIQGFVLAQKHIEAANNVELAEMLEKSAAQQRKAQVGDKVVKPEDLVVAKGEDKAAEDKPVTKPEEKPVAKPEEKPLSNIEQPEVHKAQSEEAAAAKKQEANTTRHAEVHLGDDKPMHVPAPVEAGLRGELDALWEMRKHLLKPEATPGAHDELTTKIKAKQAELDAKLADPKMKDALLDPHVVFALAREASAGGLAKNPKSSTGLTEFLSTNIEEVKKAQAQARQGVDPALRAKREIFERELALTVLKEGPVKVAVDANLDTMCAKAMDYINKSRSEQEKTQALAGLGMQSSSGYAGAVLSGNDSAQHAQTMLDVLKSGNARERMIALGKFAEMVAQDMVKDGGAKFDAAASKSGPQAKPGEFSAADAEAYRARMEQYKKDKKYTGAEGEKAPDTKDFLKPLSTEKEGSQKEFQSWKNQDMDTKLPGVFADDAEASLPAQSRKLTGAGEQSPLARTGMTVKEAQAMGYHLSEREIAAAGGPDGKLPWIIGTVANVVDPSAKFISTATEASLPQKAGVSGTTFRFMEAASLLNGDAAMSRLAMIGALETIDAHTVYEIASAAKGFGLAFDPQKPYENLGVHRDVLAKIAESTGTSLDELNGQPAPVQLAQADKPAPTEQH